MLRQTQTAYPSSLPSPSSFTKKVSFIRHGEATHNITDDYSILDPPLSLIGISQCEALHLRLKEKNEVQPELIITSPLTRTLQTSVIVFKHLFDHTSETNKGIDKNKTIPVPIIAIEQCRETLNDLPCNQRRDISSIIASDPLFGVIDFSCILTDADTDRGTEESPTLALEIAKVRARAARFAQFLQQRTESRITVVSHGGFIRAFLSNLISLGYDYWVDHLENCGTIEVTVEGDVWSTKTSLKVSRI